MQMLLVTGGWYGHDDGDFIHSGPLSSTEVLEMAALQYCERWCWRQTGPLPLWTADLKAAVLDNNIFVFGENIFCYINNEY